MLKQFENHIVNILSTFVSTQAEAIHAAAVAAVVVRAIRSTPPWRSWLL